MLYELEQITGHAPDFTESLIEIDNIEQMVFFLSNEDITKQNKILIMESGAVYKYYYLRKLKELNQLKDHLESAKRMKQ